MMDKMNVSRMEMFIPTEIEHVAPDIIKFVNLMVKKLHANRHKDSVTRKDMHNLMGLLVVECGEFLRGYDKDLLDPNNELELADVSNFAFLMFLALQDERDKL